MKKILLGLAMLSLMALNAQAATFGNTSIGDYPLGFNGAGSDYSYDATLPEDGWITGMSFYIDTFDPYSEYLLGLAIYRKQAGIPVNLLVYSHITNIGVPSQGWKSLMAAGIPFLQAGDYIITVYCKRADGNQNGWPQLSGRQGGYNEHQTYYATMGFGLVQKMPNPYPNPGVWNNTYLGSLYVTYTTIDPSSYIP